MSANNTYLAVFVGSKDSPKLAAWNALPADERKARERKGMAAWGEWMMKNQSAVAGEGGPLGKTKRISDDGITDISNNLSGFTIIRAELPEAAAKLFLDHPQFAIFPGDGVEVMPIMPIPGR